jgi:Sec-independent protein translocase protein TatA
MFGIGPLELLIVLVIGVVCFVFFAIILAAAIKILRSPSRRDDEK